jgi:hypothetical protein
MHKNVEILLGRLVTDGVLRARFAEGPATFLAELTPTLELTAVERQALAATDLQALAALADTLDPRLQRAPLSTRHLNPKETVS